MSEKSLSEKIPLKVLERFTLVPACWTKFILGWPGNAEKGIVASEPLDVGLPSSFWKYSLVLWREVVGWNCVERGFVAKKTMNDFGIRPTTASRWTAAYASSCLFQVTYGYKTEKEEPGIPSKFKYLDATELEWEVFIGTLANVERWLKRSGLDASPKVYRMIMAGEMLSARMRAGIKPPLTQDVYGFFRICEMEKKVHIGKNGEEFVFDYEGLRIRKNGRLARMRFEV